MPAPATPSSAPIQAFAQSEVTSEAVSLYDLTLKLRKVRGFSKGSIDEMVRTLNRAMLLGVVLGLVQIAPAFAAEGANATTQCAVDSTERRYCYSEMLSILKNTLLEQKGLAIKDVTSMADASKTCIKTGSSFFYSVTFGSVRFSQIARDFHVHFSMTKENVLAPCVLEGNVTILENYYRD